jgi:hypothetical protein
MRTRVGPLCLLIASAVAGCHAASPRTEVIVFIDAEQGVREMHPAIDVVVDGAAAAGGGATIERLNLVVRPGIGSDPNWPLTVALAPLDGDPTRTYQVVVTANTDDASTRFVARVRAQSGFVPGEIRALRLVLQAACVGVQCDPSHTCAAGACAVATLPTTALLNLADLDASVDAGSAVMDATADSPTSMDDVASSDARGIVDMRATTDSASVCDSGCSNGCGCQTCTTSCGTPGTISCDSLCAPTSSCIGPSETCDGQDNDCDGVVDEGFACVQNDVSSCTTSCGTTGTRSCSASCATTGCIPPLENCSNGVDDNCDGLIDAADPECMGICPSALAISAPGGRYSQAVSATSGATGSCGGAGGEAFFYFELTAPSDVFLTTHQTGANGSIDTVLYVRGNDCTTSAEVGCNDNADGLTTSVLRLTNLAAGRYNVVVDTRAVTSGTVWLDAYISTPGATSDRCGAPGNIGAGATMLSGTLIGYTNDYSVSPVASSCPYQSAREDRVYYFFLPTARSVTFAGCNMFAQAFDSNLYVRNVCGDGSPGNQAACNDDGCSGGNGCLANSRVSTLTRTLGPGLFYLFVDAYSYGVTMCDSVGAYQFSVSGI